MFFSLIYFFLPVAMSLSFLVPYLTIIFTLLFNISLTYLLNCLSRLISVSLCLNFLCLPFPRAIFAMSFISILFYLATNLLNYLLIFLSPILSYLSFILMSLLSFCLPLFSAVFTMSLFLFSLSSLSLGCLN